MVRCSVVVLTDNPGASLAGPWQWRGWGNLKLRQTQGLMTEARRFPAPWSQGDAGANIFSMLEEDEVALALAELHVTEARGRVSDQSAKITRLKSFGESSLEAEQELGLFEAYLLIVESHRDFLLRSRQQRPDKR